MARAVQPPRAVHVMDVVVGPSITPYTYCAVCRGVHLSENVSCIRPTIPVQLRIPSRQANSGEIACWLPCCSPCCSQRPGSHTYWQHFFWKASWTPEDRVFSIACIHALLMGLCWFICTNACYMRRWLVSYSCGQHGGRQVSSIDERRYTHSSVTFEAEGRRTSSAQVSGRNIPSLDASASGLALRMGWHSDNAAHEHSYSHGRGRFARTTTS